MRRPTHTNHPDAGTPGRLELIKVIDQSSKPTMLLVRDPTTLRSQVSHANSRAMARFHWVGPNTSWARGVPEPIAAAVFTTFADAQPVAAGPLAIDDSSTRFRIETACVDAHTVMLTIEEVTGEYARRDLLALWSDLVDDLDELVIVCSTQPATDSLSLPVVAASDPARVYTRSSASPVLGDIIGTIFDASDIERLDALRMSPGQQRWRAGSGHREWRCTARSLRGYLAVVLKDVSTQANILHVLGVQARQLASSRTHDAVIREALAVLSDGLLPRQKHHATALATALDAGDPDAARKQNAELVSVGARMLELVEHLATLAALDGTVRSFGPVDLGAVVEHILSTEQDTVEASGAALDIRPLPVVWGEQISLTLLVRHLTLNALTSGRPDVPLLIRIGAERSDGYWRLVFDDNGIGLTVEERARAFAPRHRPPGSAGLELAICQRIAQAHGGEVGSSAEIAGGCRVWVDLKVR